MKYRSHDGGGKECQSPPSRGAWIEIQKEGGHAMQCKVAPLAGGVD